MTYTFEEFKNSIRKVYHKEIPNLGIIGFTEDDGPSAYAHLRKDGLVGIVFFTCSPRRLNETISQEMVNFIKPILIENYSSNIERVLFDTWKDLKNQHVWQETCNKINNRKKGAA